LESGAPEVDSNKILDEQDRDRLQELVHSEGYKLL
jgi:hypothetical protein